MNPKKLGDASKGRYLSPIAFCLRYGVILVLEFLSNKSLGDFSYVYHIFDTGLTKHEVNQIVWDSNSSEHSFNV